MDYLEDYRALAKEMGVSYIREDEYTQYLAEYRCALAVRRQQYEALPQDYTPLEEWNHQQQRFIRTERGRLVDAIEKEFNIKTQYIPRRWVTTQAGRAVVMDRDSGDFGW